MILYITGVPGHGKTLRCMWHLQQTEYQDRTVLSNIEADTPTGLPKGHAPLPEDLRDAPDGAVIVIDEAQHRWKQRRPGSELTAEEDWLDTHRHHGVDLILMTQRPTAVSHHVRGCVGRHEHLQRKMGTQQATITRKDEAFNPKDFNETRDADQEIWRFPKQLFGQYKSSVEHTGAYKFKMPAKGKAFIAVIALGVAGVAYASYSLVGSFNPAVDAIDRGGSEETGSSGLPKKSEGTKQLERQVSKSANDEGISGVCVTTGDKCICYPNGGGRVTGQQCRERMKWRGVADRSPEDTPNPDRFSTQQPGKRQIQPNTEKQKVLGAGLSTSDFPRRGG